MRKWFTLVSLFFFQLIVVYFFIEDVQKLVPYFPLREVVLAIEAVFACIILVLPVVDDKKARAVTDAELIDIDKITKEMGVYFNEKMKNDESSKEIKWRKF